jgi:anti-sigma factor RsiW
VTRGLEIDCQDLVELVTDYLEDVLSPDDRRRFEEHLEICEGCDAYVEQMRETVRLTGRLTDEQIPAEMRDRLLTAFRGWRAGGERAKPEPGSV